VVNQLGGGEGECVGFAERMALQELQVSLLASLPLRDRLECVDIPAYELAERGCTLLDARERGWILKGDFAVFGPTDGGGAMRECSTFTMQNRRGAAYAYYRRISRRTVGLLASFDRRHDWPWGDKPFLSPLCLPGNR
jgi:hypothetical protein